jgi:serine protease AprX
MPKYFLRYRDPQKKGEFLQGLGGVAAAGSFLPEHDDQVLIADLAPESVALQSAAGAEIFDDIKFDFNAGAPVPATLPLNATLAQVMQQVGAPAAWKVTRGEGVTVIIVDQGVADAPEFAKKHSPLSFSLDGSSPWDSNLGHGAMCASIAAGTTAAGGRYNGAAPAASILSVRVVSLAASGVYPAYSQLLKLRSQGSLLGPVVINNSFGLQACLPPTTSSDHPFFQIIQDLAAAGIASVFSAGNLHADRLCGKPPTDCGPTTIWSANSLDSVLCVGAVDWNNSNQTLPHANSSRGPGQFSTAPGKPDCVAPTYGEVLRKGGYASDLWWGTSAAAPVVTGLLALIFSRSLSLGVALTVSDAFDIVRHTCRPLPAPYNCVGNGLVDCLAAVNAVGTGNINGLTPTNATG